MSRDNMIVIKEQFDGLGGPIVCTVGRIRRQIWEMNFYKLDVWV